MLLPGCSLLLPEGDFKAGICVLICACTYLTIAATIDFVYIVLWGKNEFNTVHQLSSVSMLLGGILFLTASILYWPSFDTLCGTTAANFGTWVFRIGSLSYLSGSCTSCHSLWYVPDKRGSPSQFEEKLLDPTRQSDSFESVLSKGTLFSAKFMWLTVIINYVVGALLFIAGGIVFQVSVPLPGTITWIIGSIFFFTGASVQLYQVVRSLDE